MPVPEMPMRSVLPRFALARLALARLALAPLVLAAGTALPASLAAEDDPWTQYLPFQSPGGAVHCVIVTGLRNYVRCDVPDAVGEPGVPAACDQRWGHAYELPERGPPVPLCTGETVADPMVQVMPAGYSHGRGGVICFSEPDGMTCMNAEAHGFTLRKGEQQLF